MRCDVMPVLGLAPLWTIMRNVPFVSYVYPVGVYGAAIEPDYPLAVRAVTLLFLAALVVGAIVARGWVERFVTGRHAGASLLMAFGGLGMGIALSGTTSNALLCVAGGLIGVSFLTGVVCWSAYLTRPFDKRRLIEIGLSLSLNYILFPSVGLLGRLFGAALPLVMAPLVMAVCWLFCLPRLDVDARPQPSRSLLFDPFVVASAVLILVGSFVRGVADPMEGTTPVRYMVSVPATLIFTGACVAVGLRPRRSRGAFDEKNFVHFVAPCWVGVVILMFAGLVWFYIGDRKQGGDIAAVAQYLLTVLLWIVLCCRVNATGVDAIGLFLLWYVALQAVSWLVRYGLVPSLVGEAGSLGPLSVDEAVTIVVLCSVAPFVIGFGLKHVVTSVAGSHGGADGAIESTENIGGAKTGDSTPMARGLDDIAAEYRLTLREVQVGELYAQGYSIGKVADSLGITVPTAQSHMRSVYRKLDVHSKDDFIRLARGA